MTQESMEAVGASQAVAGMISAATEQSGVPGFVRAPAQWFKELPRFLKAIELRLEKLPSQVQSDRV